MRVLGAILRGGQSRRFGEDKGRALFAGVPLAERVAAALAGQVDASVACGGYVTGLPILADRPAANLGPLGGINAALHFALENGFDAVLTVPCDTPVLPGTLRADLTPAPAFFVEMPVIGLWPVDLGPALDRHILADPRRSMLGWAKAIRARPISRSGPIGNINTREDLQEWEARLD